MKTFRLIGMALLAVCVSFASCSSSDNEEEPLPSSKPAIENFNQGNMNFTEEASEQDFTFTANANWTVSVAETSGKSSWCTASPASGNAGSQSVKITVLGNDTYDDRSVTITLKSGTESKSFVVTQKQKNAILLTSDKYEIEQKGGTFTVEVKANVSYTATIGETCKEWIVEGNNTRALSTTTKTYTVAVNEESEKREGTITFTDGTLSETVHIYQAGGDIILLSKNEYNVDAAGEDITVELRSNCEYEVEMPNVDWIHTASTRAMSSHTLHYTVDANETYDSREAKIVYWNKQKNVSETLTIVQTQKDAIILGEKTVEVGAEGKTIEVKLSANVNYEVEMPDVDWITTASTRGLTEHTLYYKIAQNESEDSRSAKITFKNKEKGIEDVLTVIQEGVRPTFIVVNVPTPGTLPDIVQRKEFEALKITGDLNSRDISAIRGMTIKYLDLSEANIVGGGGSYYASHGTSNDCIGDYMFFDCRGSIESIVLPNSVTSIEHDAFYKCTGLKNVNLPNSLTSIAKDAFAFCSSLTSVSIPSSVTNIGEGAFKDCTSLTSVNISGGVTSFGRHAFYNCTSLTSVSISDGVTSIGYGAFAYCSSLTSVSLPNTLISIADEAFWRCSLTSVSLPNTLISIGDHAFSECSLTSVSLPNTLISIGDHAFSGCSLTSVSIPNSVTSIGKNAFSGCSLTSVSIPSSVTSIGDQAFYGCTNLTEIYCYATTPPEIGAQIVNKETKLYVPKGTYQAYFLSKWGNNFTNIIEMED